MRKIISYAAKDMMYLLKSEQLSETDKVQLKTLMAETSSDEEVMHSLKTLCYLLNLHYGTTEVLSELYDAFKTGDTDTIKDIIDEIKNCRDGNMEELCDEALRQIEERDYTAVLRRYRFKEIRTYGIAFWDKECMVKEKKVK